MDPAISEDSPLSGSEIERTRSDPPTFWTQQEINNNNNNNNTYVIHFRPPVKRLTCELPIRERMGFSVGGWS